MSQIELDMMDAVTLQARQTCLDLSIPMIESQMGNDGNVYGNAPMTRGERIARFVDYCVREDPALPGVPLPSVMDALEGMGKPPVYYQLIREYIEDMKASPYMAPAAATIPYLNEVM